MDYISSHQVFTTAGVQAVSPSKETAETALRRAVASGKVERIRRGLYVSKVGPFRSSAPDPYDVLAAADPDAVVSYLSALAAHGVAHNVSFDVTFRSGAVKSGFEYNGVRYTPYALESGVAFQRKRFGAQLFLSVTTREQTFIDCLTHMDRSGGSEEAIRALSSMAYLDLEALEAMLAASSGAVRARAGWLLEENKEKWGVPDGLLARLEEGLSGGAVRFGSKGDPTLLWSKRWKLALPYGEEEVAGWMR